MLNDTVLNDLIDILITICTTWKKWAVLNLYISSNVNINVTYPLSDFLHYD